MLKPLDFTFEDTVVLITDPDARSFGTGFVVYQDSFASYVLTCFHVVKKIGDSIQVDQLNAEVIVTGKSINIDLAVLRVEKLPNKPILPLKTSGREGESVIVIGHQSFSGGDLLGRRVNAELGPPSWISPRRKTNIRIPVWSLKTTGDYGLQHGYSGSPVIDVQGGFIVGVASNLEGQDKGIAITITALQEIWPNCLPNPFERRKSLDIAQPDSSYAREIDEIEPLVKKASEQLQLSCETFFVSISNYGHALGRAAIGRWYSLRGEQEKAITLLSSASRLLLQTTNEYAMVQDWLALAQESRKHPSDDGSNKQNIAKLYMDWLEIQMYLVSQGLRSIEQCYLDSEPEETDISENEIET
jgi:hypothetical protein